MASFAHVKTSLPANFARASSGETDSSAPIVIKARAANAHKETKPAARDPAAARSAALVSGLEAASSASAQGRAARHNGANPASAPSLADHGPAVPVIVPEAARADAVRRGERM